MAKKSESKRSESRHQGRRRFLVKATARKREELRRLPQLRTPAPAPYDLLEDHLPSQEQQVPQETAPQTPVQAKGTEEPESATETGPSITGTCNDSIADSTPEFTTRSHSQGGKPMRKYARTFMIYLATAAAAVALALLLQAVEYVAS